MPIRQETKTIGNTEYQVSQLGFAAARKTAVLLANLAGPLLAQLLRELVESAKGKDPGKAAVRFMDSLGSLDVSQVGGVAGDFLARLSDSDLETLTETFAKQTLFHPDGSNGFMPLTREARELHFAGDGFTEYFQWLWFCLEVNYSGFFSGLSRFRGSGPSLGSPAHK